MNKKISQNQTKVEISKTTSGNMSSGAKSFNELIEIVARLRGPGGCPWDQEQTAKSLTQYAIEEAFELAEAIEAGSKADVQEELGDFLFQVVLQAQVAEDEGHFDLSDVIKQLNEKMIYRHPHVFADNKTSNLSIAEIWKNWEKLKTAENTKAKPIFNYPRKMPALLAANKIGVKAKGYKFDWTQPEQVIKKVDEELMELKQALQNNERSEIEHEIGDMLFTLAQLARHCDIDPEQALRGCNRRFENRFNKVLELSKMDKDQFSELSVAAKEELWSQAKKLT